MPALIRVEKYVPPDMYITQQWISFYAAFPSESLRGRHYTQWLPIFLGIIIVLSHKFKCIFIKSQNVVDRRRKNPTVNKMSVIDSLAG